MSYIHFDGFVENYDAEKVKFSKKVEPLVKDTIMSIVHRYKNPDPVFPAKSDIADIEFRGPNIVFDWKVDFRGKLYTTSDSVAQSLVNDSQKSYEKYGLTQTFNYDDDTFQVYVNFRDIKE